MNRLKRYFKRNSHNSFFKGLAGFGRALNRFYENRNHDTYSNGELTVLKKIAQSNPSIIIDGGANIGNYSLLAAQFNANSRIYAFEPVESTYNEMCERGGDSKIIPINKGLFSDNISREINIYNSSTHSSLYDIKGISYSENEKCTIDLVRGDDFVREYKIASIDLLKLDLEGAEYDALLGFEDSLKKGIIKAVQFEYGYINITTKKLLVDFYELLEKYNYVLGKIFPKYVEFRDYKFKYEDFIGPNFIAINKNETELIKLMASK